MPGALGVWLGPTRVGTVTNLSGDYNVFSFEESYVDDPRRIVLSQGLLGKSGAPIRVVPRTHRVAPPFFANLLPEEDTMLRAILARHNGLSRTRDFPFLAALGSDLPGAVVIRRIDAEGVIEEDGAARTEPGEHAPSRERPLRFSLAGVQLKFSASVVADRMTVPAEGAGGSWIVKLPTNAWARLPENEHTMMLLAARLGLDVPSIRLIDLGAVDALPDDIAELRSDEPPLAYVIARFDRPADASRCHVEDFNQIAGQPPAQKYDNRATHWIANVVATLCPVDDVDEFVRRLVFGVCIGNNDMHLKNWALIYPDGRNARLAPLYDYVCTRRYFPNAGLALTIGGERAFERIDRETLRRFAERAEISVKRTIRVADELVARLRDVWKTFKETIPEPRLAEVLEAQFAAVPLMNGR